MSENRFGDPVRFDSVKAFGVAGGFTRGCTVTVDIEGKSDTVEAVRLVVEAAPGLLEMARAIVLEAGLIDAAHNQPKHHRAWQNSGERWANMARAAVAKAEA